MPAANSRVSPGQEEPDQQAALGEQDDGQHDQRARAGQQGVRADRVGQRAVARQHRAELTGATRGHVLRAQRARLSGARRRCADTGGSDDRPRGARDADRHARDLRRHARPRQGAAASPIRRSTARRRRRSTPRCKGFADAGSDGIIQFSTGGAEFGSGTDVKDMVTGAVGAGRVRARRRGEVPDQRRAAHRPLPEGQAGQLRPPAARRSRRSASTPARSRCSSRTCGTARRSSWRRTCRSPPSCWSRRPRRTIILELEIGVVGGEEDGVVGGR